MDALCGLAIYTIVIASMYGKPVYDSSADGTANPGRGRFKGAGNTQSVVPKPFGLEQDSPGGDRAREGRGWLWPGQEGNEGRLPAGRRRLRYEAIANFFLWAVSTNAAIRSLV